METAYPIFRTRSLERIEVVAGALSRQATPHCQCRDAERNPFHVITESADVVLDPLQ